VLPPLFIGSLKIDFPVLLAPMEGYTHLPFRILCREMGAGLTFTELTAAKDIARRVPRALEYLNTAPAERPVAAHLYGSEPTAFAEASAYVTGLNGFDLIDLNAGCPVSKIVRRGEGAGLMKTPDKICELVRAIKSATGLPVTVKTRMGSSEREFNALELLRAAEEGGADAMTVHARFTVNRHSGPADWTALARIKAAAKIPIIGNGGVAGVADAERLFHETGVDGIMIGQAAIGNPWIFHQIRARFEGRSAQPPEPEERLRVMERHVRALVAQMTASSRGRVRTAGAAEEAAVRLFRAHLVRYLAGQPGFAALRMKLGSLNTVTAVLEESKKALSSAE
jgi:nifR3 family TIM-barrel protein